jgi:hypothetical protein
MITFLAKRKWGRFVLLPVVFCAGAFSWGTYAVRGVPDDKKAMWKNCWGWLSPQMEEHWDMLADTEFPGRKSTFHELKNIGSEYCRVWPQTAYKAGSFLVACVIVLTAVLGAIL